MQVLPYMVVNAKVKQRRTFKYTGVCNFSGSAYDYSKHDKGDTGDKA